MLVKHFQNNFTGGEWTSRLDSRADLNKYQNALRYLENFIILPHGGVRARGGFHYAAGVKTHSRKVRLIPFEFNVPKEAPPSYKGEYIESSWQVKVNIDIPLSFDIHAEKSVEVER